MQNVYIDKNGRQKYIDYLKVLACILIINSHCRNIYPHYFLAIGGGFGNSIFFILSGFCLINIKNSFKEWYIHRMKRIVPVSIGAGIIGLFVNGGHPVISDGNMLSIGKFYLDRYWFVFAILIYYVLYYFIFKNLNMKYIKYSLLVYFLGYVILYAFLVDKSKFSIELEGFSPFKVYFYFGIFIFGGYMRIIIENIKNSRKMILRLMLLLGSSIIIWCLVYMFITVFEKGLKVQFVIHVCVFVFAIVIVVLGRYYENKITEKKFINTICGCIAESTLEIYLIQVTVQKSIEQISFPINFLVFILVSFVGGILYHKIIKKVEKIK